jgi:hypothetical protein
MPSGTIISDIIGTLIGLSPLFALGAFVLAGLALRGEGGTNFNMGGSFTKYLIWSAIFFALPGIVTQAASWAGASNLPGLTGATVGKPIISAATSALQYVGTKLLPIFGGALIFKALLDSAEGKSPLPSIVSSLFVMGLAAAVNASASASASASTYSPDTLLSLYLTYATGTLCPIIASMCVAAAIVTYVRGGKWGGMVLTAVGFLTVTGVTTLIKGYEGVQ